jgi:long-chain acyl-CoA synthetase
MIASHLGIPVVPVRIVGLDKVLNRSAKWPHPGPVELRIGRPLDLGGDAYADLASQVEDAVRKL